MTAPLGLEVISCADDVEVLAEELFKAITPDGKWATGFAQAIYGEPCRAAAAAALAVVAPRICARTIDAAAAAFDELQTPDQEHYSRRDPALWLHRLREATVEAAADQILHPSALAGAEVNPVPLVSAPRAAARDEHGNLLEHPTYGF